jgi:hypothetical protein
MRVTPPVTERCVCVHTPHGSVHIVPANISAPRNSVQPPTNPSTQIGFIDENVDHLHWLFFGNVVIQALRHQDDLRPSLALNESLFKRLHHVPDDQKIEQFQTFHTG